MADLGKVSVTDGGNYASGTTYEKLTFVHYLGDAYLTLKTVKGITPTDDGVNYKLFCKSAVLATDSKAGIVLPDGATTSVDSNGKISVKKATTSAAGIVKPASTDFTVASDGTEKINTEFTQATALANIIANEAWLTIMGKISKAIATTMNLDQNALMKNMMSGIDVNSADKVPTSAYIHSLVERIGMGDTLDVGTNLTNAVSTLNSDLGVLRLGLKYKTGKIVRFSATPVFTNGTATVDLSSYYEDCTEHALQIFVTALNSSSTHRCLYHTATINDSTKTATVTAYYADNGAAYSGTKWICGIYFEY